MLLQGIWGGQVKKEVNSMISDLQLADKRKTQTRQLSGGMMRKLRYGNVSGSSPAINPLYSHAVANQGVKVVCQF